MFCHECGSLVAAEAAFCHACGTKLYPAENTNLQSDVSAANEEIMTDWFDATLTNVGDDVVSVVKKVRELTGLGLRESMDLVDKAPAVLKKAVTQAEAEWIKAEFLNAGATVSFINQEGHPVDIIMHCRRCGAVRDHGSEACSSCGNAFANTATVQAAMPTKEDIASMSSSAKVLAVLGILLAIGLAVFILQWIFSSTVTMIVIAAGGYIVYHQWIAVKITRNKYIKAPKGLQLPDGMTAQSLLEALSGKFNYPYFKGIRYGENGACVIDGRYSVYPVVFDEHNHASLTCSLNVDEKKLRATMLEAMAIRSYIQKFFNPSLPFDAVKDLKALQSAEKQRKAVAIVLSVASFLVVAVLALEYAFPGGIQRIATPGIEVRSAYLSEYSTEVTIEDAFDAFFEKPKWSTYTSEGYSYVAFTGACEILGERAEVKIAFKITGNQFIVDHVDVNGREQSVLLTYSLLSAIYEDY